MRRLNINNRETYLSENGAPFFFAADTVWSAFNGPTLVEWEEYFRVRKRQGFNVLQITILPLWDGGNLSPFETERYMPFAMKSNGKLDFSSINEKYFDRACLFTERAVAAGFVPALVLIWGDYVPGTWGAAKNPGLNMTPRQASEYVEYAVKRFAKYSPIFILGGDTDINDESAKVYLDAAAKVRKFAPESLVTVHLCGENSNIIQPLADAVDFYMYQSGHFFREVNFSIKLAEDFSRMEPKRPIINSEPCYEGHRRAAGFGRYSSYDVRRATWQSILSGAQAGITYGAHGLWGFALYGEDGKSLDFAGRPYDWHDAIRMEGAWDIGFARHIWEKYELWGVKPYEGVRSEAKDSCFALDSETGRFVFYLPYADKAELPPEFNRHKLTFIDLKTRRVIYAEVFKNDEGTVIPVQDVSEDMLIIGETEFG